MPRSSQEQAARRRSPLSIGKRDPSLKWPHLYDLLRAKGYDKEKSARISNSRVHLRKKGRLEGLPYRQADSKRALKGVLKAYQSKHGRTASAVVAACYSAACAPPPTGTGGSGGGGTGSMTPYSAAIDKKLIGRHRQEVLVPQPNMSDIDYECEAGACTTNASELDGEWGTRYAEGYAKAPDHADWIAHAWLVTQEGKVIDPTWTDTKPGFEYVEASDLDPFERGNDFSVTHLIAACYSAACAPPPAGRGGSLKVTPGLARAMRRTADRLDREHASATGRRVKSRIGKRAVDTRLTAHQLARVLAGAFGPA